MTLNKNILIVEDEVIIAYYIQDTIESMGYSCAGIAINALKAREIINQKKVDLVLMDINIQGYENGLQLAKDFVKKHQIPVIFMTSYSDRKTFDEIKAICHCSVLSKPLNEKLLEETLATHFN